MMVDGELKEVLDVGSSGEHIYSILQNQRYRERIDRRKKRYK